MVDLPEYPPLKPLHPDSSLNVAKLTQMDRLSTETPAFLTGSGRGREEGCLKTRPDGTILERHDRICILRQRGVDVNNRPREIVVKEQA
jgi:hypothetical protein